MSYILCLSYWVKPKHPFAVDATRLSDRATVVIKRVRKGTNEITIAQFLSSDSLRRDPRNHCVPIIETFCDESEPATEFLVMPILRKFNSDFIRQTLEVNLCMLTCRTLNWLMLSFNIKGLVFLHGQGVAHRWASKDTKLRWTNKNETVQRLFWFEHNVRCGRNVPKGIPSCPHHPGCLLQEGGVSLAPSWRSFRPILLHGLRIIFSIWWR